ncbi:uncharacterized protein LOC6545136 [Drosophila erecta]|uniref:Pleiotrophin/Midkine C-terminal domain-containing protein n=1 Tax=Drosophila erecta TaxID=7220 RepID=B3NEN3_DROER|nr:uncharacterized protein LOC6545136 [Drosophila erecta]XP_026832864.1 uncharacterized protein LOC6545136 [Drosophila erecta]EDV50028.1 uncharacterized protein Dere_GG14711 [Drosophila erecta]
MNLILAVTTALQLALVVLAQSPLSVRGQSLSDGIRLVMEKRSGDVVHIRPARGTPEAETVGSTTNGDSHRTRNNRKANKSQEHFQQVGGHKSGSGSRKQGVAENGGAQLSQPNHKQGHKNTDKQPRQGGAKQRGHGQHHGGNRKGPKAATSENGSTCRYAKSAWSNCDQKTNMRSRVLSLRKGEQNCLPTRTIQKKCKKGCRYEKGEWSQCVGGQITREDKLEPEATGGSDQNCNPVRTVSKKCKANGNSSGGKQHGQSRRTKEQKQKDKGAGRIST